MADEVKLIDAEKLKQKLIEGDGHDDDRFTEGYNFAINEIKEYIDNMPTIEAEPDKGWISVEDRLPEPITWVLVFARQGSYMNLKVDYITRDGIWVKSMRVTHWRPLPEPPKGK